MKRGAIMSRHSMDSAKVLSERLPISLTCEDVEKYPEFTKVLHALSSHVSPDGTSSSTDRDLKDAEKSLRMEKTRWLYNKVLYAEIENLLQDFHIDKAKVSKGTEKHVESNKFCEALQEVLTLAEIPDYFDTSTDPENPVSLLDLHQEDVQAINPYSQHVQSIQQKLIPDIESRLRKRCDDLANYYHLTQNSSKPDEYLLTQTSQLPNLIEKEKLTQKSRKKTLRRDRLEREEKYWNYSRALLDCCQLLEVLITRHRLGSQPDNDKVNSEWLAARCDGLCLKLKSFELQLLVDTYQAEHVKALGIIRYHLDQELVKTAEEIERKSHALESYMSVGMGFDKIVTEYSDLLEEIERRQWGLKELNKHRGVQS